MVDKKTNIEENCCKYTCCVDGCCSDSNNCCSGH